MILLGIVDSNVWQWTPINAPVTARLRPGIQVCTQSLLASTDCFAHLTLGYWLTLFLLDRYAKSIPRKEKARHTGKRKGRVDEVTSYHSQQGYE